jgi:hypothetical protein
MRADLEVKGHRIEQQARHNEQFGIINALLRSPAGKMQ